MEGYVGIRHPVQSQDEEGKLALVLLLGSQTSGEVLGLVALPRRCRRASWRR